MYRENTRIFPTTVRNITNVVLEDINQWQKQTLNKRYSVLYLDGCLYQSSSHVVVKEVIYLVVGLTKRDVVKSLVFYGGNVSSLDRQEMLQDLYECGLKEVLLGVFDGLVGEKIL
ncbi:transposase [Tepidibacillus marianensis]|uniref:transposase n=1 Tax=Tepidibacillus marianensis TaxID=3131995 RepID=UPI0030D08DC4